MSDNLIGSTTAVFPVRLSSAASDPVDVQWSTRDGTAIGGTDYKPANGTVAFLPGDTEKQIEVIVYGQHVTPAPEKVFFIKLSPPNNAVLVDSLLTCRIVIDDSGVEPVLEIVVAEGRRGPKGEPGMSSYDLAVFMGEFTGTLEEWMAKEASAGRAADRAEAAAVAANIGGKVYSTPEAGVNPLTGVPVGDYFNVRSPLSAFYVDEYQNITGSAVATGKSYPSAKGLIDAVNDAQSSAEIAEAAATAANISGKVYPTPEAGVDPTTGVASGEYYNVRSASSDNYVDEYRNVSGVATATGKSYPSSSFVKHVADHTPLPFKTGESYGINRRVELLSGEIVRSTVANNTVDPNVDMTGWKYLEPLCFSDISSLLAFTKHYNGLRVTVGGKQGGYFEYNSIKSTINDGGTIFNGWERIYFQHIDFDMFNVQNIGGDSLIQNAFNASKTLKKPLINKNGTYIITGTSNIEIGYDYDLTGTTFKLASTFTGAFVITRNAETIVHDASSNIVTLIKSQGVISGNATSLPVLENNDVLNDSFIELNSSQEMYRYREEVITRYELNRVFNKGQIASTFFYDLDLSTITSMSQQKVQDSKFFGSGLTIDETERDYGGFYVFVRDGNNFDLKNFRFINKNFTSRLNTYNRVHVSANAHAVKIDGIDTSATYINSNGDSNYTFSATKCFDLTVSNVCADGYGWGAVGMNSCKRVTFNDSQISRIDFHQPCHDFLILNDCLIGDWGVLVTLRGDLILNNPRFIMRKVTNNNGFIRSRIDTGGWCNGDLIINNMVIEGELTVNVPLLNCQASYSNKIPENSPVRPTFFDNVVINGFKQKSNLLSYIIDCPRQNLVESGSDNVRLIQAPKDITINDFIYNTANFDAGFRLGYFRKRNEGMTVNIDNAEFYRLLFLDPQGVGTETRAELHNVRGSNNNGVLIVNTCNASIDSINSKTQSYSEVANSVFSSFSPPVRFIGGQLKNTINSTYFSLQANAKDRVKLHNIDILVGSIGAFRVAIATSLNNFTLNGNTGIPLSASTTISAFGVARVQAKSGTVYGEILIDLSTAGAYTIGSGSLSVSVSANVATITISGLSSASILSIT